MQKGYRFEGFDGYFLVVWNNIDGEYMLLKENNSTLVGRAETTTQLELLISLFKKGKSYE